MPENLIRNATCILAVVLCEERVQKIVDVVISVRRFERTRPFDLVHAPLFVVVKNTVLLIVESAPLLANRPWILVVYCSKNVFQLVAHLAVVDIAVLFRRQLVFDAFNIERRQSQPKRF